MKTPEPIYLQHLSASAMKRVDYWMGQPDVGSITLHRSKDDGRVKLQVQVFEVIEEEVPSED
jgi:hypothetical protein